MPQTKPTASRRRMAFTLVELLVVIAIIAVLIGILIPVVSHVRKAAQDASTKAFIAELSGAMDNYFNDFHSYPGPLPNDSIYTALSGNTGPTIAFLHNGVASGNLANTSHISGAENAVLGLVGGLSLSTSGQLQYDDSLVGKGAMSLNPGQPKRYNTYIETSALSPGHFKDDSGDADDTIIPEFVDKFNDPMPVLILRANSGRTMDTSQPLSSTNNSVITDGTLLPHNGNYDITQIISYTGAFSGAYPEPTDAAPNPTSGLSLDKSNRVPGSGERTIGVGKYLPKACSDGSGTMKAPAVPYHGLGVKIDTASNTSLMDAKASGNPRNRYYFPYDAYAYFTNPQMPLPTSTSPNVIPTPRRKDTYILISAGKDRVYGTDDDITNFGSVGQ